MKIHRIRLGHVSGMQKAKIRQIHQQRVVTSLSEADLIAKVYEVGSETKFRQGAEGDEQEKIWVISRLEGGHLGGKKERGSGRRSMKKFMKVFSTCIPC